MTGTEPAYSAWKADVLPLNYTGMTRPVRLPGGSNREEIKREDVRGFWVFHPLLLYHYSIGTFGLFRIKKDYFGLFRIILDYFFSKIPLASKIPVTSSSACG